MTERSLRTSRQERQCRICLDTTDISKFVSPCDCRGSIEFVHLSCLQEYFAHKFKTTSAMERRRMKESIRCEICHSEIKCLKITPQKRCANCEQMSQRMQGEDVFFIFIYMLLYIGFHAVGVVLIMQDQLISRIIGVFWLILSIIAFNYGLYKIIKEVCYIREAKVNYFEERPLLLGDQN